MLSILIPVYNFDIRPLVADLRAQCEQTAQPYEIICFDDGSKTHWQEINEEVRSEKVILKSMGRNLGRSAIRNALGKAARFPYLLFMDNDSKVVRKDYIQKYLAHLAPSTLLYGGRCYAANPPADPAYFFHWNYGSNREQTTPTEREKQPWHSFMTNNFLIPKAIFEKINFDESLRQYGHEDTLFGLQLAQAGVKIKHLDNPLEHLGLETTDVFLKKTEQGLENLYQLWKAGTPIETKLLEYFIRLKKWGLIRFTAILFKVFKPLVLNHLMSKKPNLLLFDFYKLGFLCTLHK